MDKQALKDYQRELGTRFVTVPFTTTHTNMTLLVDKETGVEYLTGGFAGASAIKPLLNADGTLKINTKWQAGEL